MCTYDQINIVSSTKGSDNVWTEISTIVSVIVVPVTTPSILLEFQILVLGETANIDGIAPEQVHDLALCLVVRIHVMYLCSSAKREISFRNCFSVH